MRRPSVIVVVIAALVAIAILTLALLSMFVWNPPTNPGASFTFAAAGDFGAPGSGEMSALAKRLRAANASFLLALGDLGYTADEAGWCAALKADYNDVEVIAGNHDTAESGPGEISETVLSCPFTLNASVTAAPGTPGSGYGYGYRFDYPAGRPLARFILIAAGVGGALNYDYGPGSAHATWVVDSVQDARSRGISWVIVGMHKQCITVGAKPGCDMGQAIFDTLVDLRVDLILQGHDHVYERSKQLALTGSCTTVPSAGGFNPACVAAGDAGGSYPKRAGSVVVIQGTGGAGPYVVRIDGTDPEMGYFVSVMGENANTQNRTRGFGSVRYAVTGDRITAETDFCPTGSTDGTGHCPSARDSTFADSFIIQGPAAAPQAAPSSAAIWARVSETVSFDGPMASDEAGLSRIG